MYMYMYMESVLWIHVGCVRLCASVCVQASACVCLSARECACVHSCISAYVRICIAQPLCRSTAVLRENDDTITFSRELTCICLFVCLVVRFI